jgi:preprotein translocase subunit YajC
VNSAGFLIIIIAFGFLWLVVVRPQKRKQVEQRRMIADLHVGDEVLTAGGIFGRVTELGDDELTLEIAPQLEVRVARRAIAGVTREPAEEPDEPAEEPSADDHGG